MKRLAALLISCLLLTASLPAGAEARAEDVFFEGAVFIGDSIMQQIGRYKMEQEERGRPVLGKAHFMAVSSYTLYQGSRIAPLKHKAALRYAGEKVSLADALHKMEAKKAFILLGLNDRAGTQLSQEMLMYRRLIQRALDRNPGLEMVILSVTPITKGGQTRYLKQENFDAFNRRLEQLCREMGVSFLDMASPLKDEEGYLREDYVADGRVHLNPRGMQAFVEALYAFAASRMH